MDDIRAVRVEPLDEGGPVLEHGTLVQIAGNCGEEPLPALSFASAVAMCSRTRRSSRT
jgi:hypothetical protein